MTSAGVRIIVENVTEDAVTDLGQCLAFSVENVGTVGAELFFDESQATAELPAGMNREFDFLGARYTGQLNVRFKAAEGGQFPRVTVIKRAYPTTCK